jgi:hypothetical protein
MRWCGRRRSAGSLVARGLRAPRHVPSGGLAATPAEEGQTMLPLPSTQAHDDTHLLALGLPVRDDMVLRKSPVALVHLS